MHVIYTSAGTATRRSAALQGDTPRDTEETARTAENSQLAGRFRRWWQVLGSNQRRLSRRFYRPLSYPRPTPLTSTYTARGSFPGRGRPPCVRRHWGLVHGRGGKTTDGGGGSGYADRPPGFVPLTWHFRMSARCRRLPRRRVQTRVRCPGRRGRRWSACLRRQPARRCSGRRSSAGRRRRARGLGEWNQRPAVASSVHLSMIIRWISLVPSKIVKIVDERSVSAGQRRVWGCGISTDPAPDFGGRRRLPAARICCRAPGVAQEGAANPWYQLSAQYCAEVHRRYIFADLPAHAPRAAMAHAGCTRAQRRGMPMEPCWPLSSRHGGVTGRTGRITPMAASPPP